VSIETNVREEVELLGYRLEAVIGLGGMGVVYRAVDLRLNRAVALKLMAPALARDDRFRARFTQESELAMSLEHPNVIPIHDAGEVDGRLFLAMRLVEGGTLRSLLREQGALEPARAVAITRQVANALDAAHAKGLVHRDVKPSNVLLDQNEHVYLADFGLSRRLDEQSARSGDNRSLGTPAYLAPEQIEGGRVDGRADVYSLGCLLFECLSGEPPFARSSRLAVAWAHLEEEPPPVTARNPALPSGVDAVIQRAMEKEPARRYPTCAELVDDATAALGVGGAAVDAASTGRRLRLFAAAGALVFAVAVGAAAFVLTRDAEAIHTAGAAVLDPETGDLRQTVPLGTAPSNVAVGEGSAWIVDADDRTIWQVDAKTREVRRTFSPTPLPTDVAAGAGALWVANAYAAEGTEDSASLFPESVVRLDPESGEVDATIALPRFPGGHEFSVFPGVSRQQIALTPRAVWVINAKRSVSRIDPLTNRVVATIGGVSAENIAAGEGEVWVTEGNHLVRIDQKTNRVSGRIAVDAETLSGLAVAAGAVWVSDPFGGKVWRVATRPKLSKQAIPLEEWVAGVAYGEGAVWATNEIADAVYRIDPQTSSVRTLRRTAAPRSVAVGAGSVWVTAASPPSSDASLPAPPCGRVFYPEGGDPQLLIASDLPLKGDARPFTKPMADAIRHIFRQRGFRAGRHSVGYVSCDSSTAQGGMSDFFRCGSNAKAFARNLSVVAVFGAYSSPCSAIQIPIANRAPQGPLAMLSPSNTHRELTTNPDYYPTGARNYVRIAGADHLQAVAHAEFVRLLGRRRLVTLAPRDDEDSARFAADVGVVARRLGLELVGSPVYDAEGRGFSDLAQRVARTRPDAVVVAGILLPGTGALIRDLRAALGPRVAIVAPDGFAVVDDLVKLAGPGARGDMYVSTYGLPNSHLPPRGQRFLDAFAPAQGTGPGPDFAAAYGAQGAELLLDAVARSDGTRSSVVREVRRTSVHDGLLGRIRFDRNGDLEQGPFTFLRVVGDDFVVDRVVTARAARLRG
jgi:ABC-type branched-subunit amino acid transport system substrate-binding protein/DNA-binding beta-propeller fold protein YncE